MNILGNFGVGILISVCLRECEGHPYFMDLIPNGKNVPDPCPNATPAVWHRVGHMIKLEVNDKQNPKTTLNEFGKVFVIYFLVFYSRVSL